MLSVAGEVCLKLLDHVCVIRNVRTLDHVLLHQWDKNLKYFSQAKKYWVRRYFANIVSYSHLYLLY